MLRTGTCLHRLGKCKCRHFIILLIAERKIGTHTHVEGCTLLDIIVNWPPTGLTQLEAPVCLEMCWLFYLKRALPHRKHTGERTHPFMSRSLDMCPHSLLKKKKKERGVMFFFCLFTHCLTIALKKTSTHTHARTHTLGLLCISLNIYERLNH